VALPTRGPPRLVECSLNLERPDPSRWPGQIRSGTHNFLFKTSNHCIALRVVVIFAYPPREPSNADHHHTIVTKADASPSLSGCALSPFFWSTWHGAYPSRKDPLSGVLVSLLPQPKTHGKVSTRRNGRTSGTLSLCARRLRQGAGPCGTRSVDMPGAPRVRP